MCIFGWLADESEKRKNAQMPKMNFLSNIGKRPPLRPSKNADFERSDVEKKLGRQGKRRAPSRRLERTSRPVNVEGELPVRFVLDITRSHHLNLDHIFFFRYVRRRQNFPILLREPSIHGLHRIQLPRHSNPKSQRK